jgi:hypothetical protein
VLEIFQESLPKVNVFNIGEEGEGGKIISKVEKLANIPTKNSLTSMRCDLIEKKSNHHTF